MGSLNINLLLRPLIIGFVASGLFGCIKRAQNPEVSDPIYQDIQAKISQTEGAIHKMDEEIRIASEEKLKTVPLYGPYRTLDAKIYRLKGQRDVLNQRLHYYHSFLLERKITVKKRYLKESGEEPRPTSESEVSAYMATQGRRPESLSWSSAERVRKLAGEGTTGASPSKKSAHESPKPEEGDKAEKPPEHH